MSVFAVMSILEINVNDSRDRYGSLERYLLFVNRHGQIYQGQVFHTPYPAYKAHLLSIEQTLTQSHGFDCSTPPLYIHASPGVDVEVFDLIAL